MVDALLLRARLLALAHTGVADGLSKGTRGALVGELNRAVGGDTNRRIVLAWLFRAGVGELSTLAMTVSEWYALWRWEDMHADEIGHFHPQPSFYPEAFAALREAMRARAVKVFGVDYDGMVAEAAALPGNKLIRETTYDDDKDTPNIV